MTELVFGDGVMSTLATQVARFPDPVVVVSGLSSFESSGAAPLVDVGLRGRRWQQVVARGAFPGKDSAAAGLAALAGVDPQTVIAVGGGTVIDTAKLICLGLTNGGIEAVLDANTNTFEDGVGLIAIPTTAGSGSERTPFAVAYVDSLKRSIEHASIAPRLALVDPTLTHSMSREVTISSGLDAFSHAMESLWSTKATGDSIELSKRALALAWDNVSTVADAATPSARRLMAEASTTAGAAIATARTTASHALSYHLSARYGVPHGVAVALTLGALLVFNSAVGPDSVTHPGGFEKVRLLVAEICEMMGTSDPNAARAALLEKMKALGVPTTLSDIGLKTAGQIRLMIESVNQERLYNNPRRLDEEGLGHILEEIR